jgi:heterodisulfide reductase subunit B
MSYAYFPGCSLKGLGKAYEESFLAVCKALSVSMAELDDWNCCGATAYMSVDEMAAFTLAGRNLAKAEQEGHDIVAPCAGCYLSMMKANDYIAKYPKVAERVGGALNAIGLKYEGKAKVRHPLDVFVNDIGLDRIKEQVKMPLKGLKVACYYGCQIVRPYSTFDVQHDPQTMDQIVKALGGNPVKYPLKTKCCGGSHTGTIPQVGEQMVYLLLKETKRRGMELIITACPLCQFNLEAYQDRIANEYGDVTIPVLHFTQLMGLAFGLPEGELGMHRQIVSATEVLKMRQLIPAGGR